MVGILIISGIGMILVLFTDFGGVYYYGYVQVWYYINILSFPYNIALFLVVFFFLFTLLHSILYFMKHPKAFEKKMFQLGLIFSFITLLMAIIGLIALMIEGLIADDWWVDTSFYSTLIGGLLNFLLYYFIRNSAIIQQDQ